MNGKRSEPGTPGLLRRLNDRAVLSALMDTARSSRNELAALTRLSKVTTAESIRRLETLGLVRSLGLRTGSLGRQAGIYEPVLERALAVAVDVRHDSVSAALVDATGHSHPVVRVPGPAGRPVSDLLRDAVRLAAEATTMAADDVGSLLVGVQASVDVERDSLSCSKGLEGWPHVETAATLSDVTGFTVALENDANLAAGAERAAGTGVDAQSFILAWLDCGPGLAIMVGDRLMRGASGTAGEIEDLLAPAGANILGRTAEHLSDLIDARAVQDFARHHGVPPVSWASTLAMIGELEPGHPFFKSFAKSLETALTPVIAVVDPELVVLQGPIGLAGGEQLAAAFDAVLSGRVRGAADVRPPTVIEEPVLVGARLRLAARMQDQLLAHIDE